MLEKILFRNKGECWCFSVTTKPHNYFRQNVFPHRMHTRYWIIKDKMNLHLIKAFQLLLPAFLITTMFILLPNSRTASHTTSWLKLSWSILNQWKAVMFWQACATQEIVLAFLTFTMFIFCCKVLCSHSLLVLLSSKFIWPLGGDTGACVACLVFTFWCCYSSLRRCFWSPFANLNWLPPSQAFVNGGRHRAEETHSIKKPSCSSCVWCSVRNNVLQMFLLSAGKAAGLSFVDVSFIQSFGWGLQTFALSSHILHNAMCA